jgi:MOSC domain-containing protein YiiM
MPAVAGDGQMTGIGKFPVESAEFRPPGTKQSGLGSGVVGDFIGSRKHHGGDDQAIYAYAREELDAWQERLDRQIPNGMFGENLTTIEVDVDGAHIGERWAVGNEVVLEVRGPRIPCATFQARMGVKGWVKRFTEVGNSGAYMAVIIPGTVTQGDAIKIEKRPDHGVDLRLTFRAFNGDIDAMEQVVASACLPLADHLFLANRLQRLT